MPPKNFNFPDLRHVKIILVEPQTPGNVGSVARAMNNFGLTDLRLVHACDHLSAEAKLMAVKSEAILERAVCYATLAEALRDVHFSVSTTVRIRDTHFPTFTPKEAAEKIIEISPQNTVALVFGREHSGLTTEEIHQCRIISMIPTHPSQPSINLAQSVMIYTCEIFQQSLAVNPNFYWDYADPQDVEILYDRLQRILEKIGFRPKTTNEDFLVGLRRILGRTPLEDRDVRILHKIFQEIEFFITKN
jgi:TrmH family RNA methyltransferase